MGVIGGGGALNANTSNFPNGNSITYARDPAKVSPAGWPTYQEIHAFFTSSAKWAMEVHDDAVVNAIAMVTLAIEALPGIDLRYKVITLDLTSGGTNVALGLGAAGLKGRAMTVMALTGTVEIKFNGTSAFFDSVPLSSGMAITGYQFTEIYATFAAQPGKTLVVWVQGINV